MHRLRTHRGVFRRHRSDVLPDGQDSKEGSRGGNRDVSARVADDRVELANGVELSNYSKTGLSNFSR
jgi:hypothetical protein